MNRCVRDVHILHGPVGPIKMFLQLWTSNVVGHIETWENELGVEINITLYYIMAVWLHCGVWWAMWWGKCGEAK